MESSLSENNPWKVKSKKIGYENPWIIVRHHEVEHPDGSDGIYGVVEFKNIAVGVLPIDENDNVFLVGQYRFAQNAYSWEIPEGGSPMGEDLLETGKRELEEELGILAEDWSLLHRDIQMSNSVTNEIGILFTAKNLTFVKSRPESSEQLKMLKIPFEEALQWVYEGKIQDSLTIIALLKHSIEKAKTHTLKLTKQPLKHTL